MYRFRYQFYVLIMINLLFGQEIIQDRIIVKIAPDTDGLVHISEIQDKRTNKVEDILN